MYKKFLVSMLMTVALAGCGHQSSDKQGDQTDTALPVQDQITSPVDQGQQPVGPATVEPTQPPPANADTTTPAAGTDSSATTPATPPPAGTPSTTEPTSSSTDKKDTSSPTS